MLDATHQVIADRSAPPELVDAELERVREERDQIRRYQLRSTTSPSTVAGNQLWKIAICGAARHGSGSRSKIGHLDEPRVDP